MKSKKIVTSWSGGKDSCYALMQAIKSGMQPVALLNMLNEKGKISRSHAIPKEVLQRQADLLDLPVITTPASWQDYERLFIQSLKEIKAAYQIDSAVFGDIDLQEHRDWEEKVCKVMGLEAVLPLWRKDRKELVFAMMDGGIEATIVSCNEVMGEAFLGRKISRELISELEKICVDPCGENGEYHTLVVNCPLFKERLNVGFGKKVKHENYWFIEMV